jgi:hypothetical protein
VAGAAWAVAATIARVDLNYVTQAIKWQRLAREQYELAALLTDTYRFYGHQVDCDDAIAAQKKAYDYAAMARGAVKMLLYGGHIDPLEATQ